MLREESHKNDEISQSQKNRQLFSSFFEKKKAKTKVDKPAAQKSRPQGFCHPAREGIEESAETRPSQGPPGEERGEGRDFETLGWTVRESQGGRN